MSIVRSKMLSPPTRLATPADRGPWADAHGYMLSPLRGYVDHSGIARFQQYARAHLTARYWLSVLGAGILMGTRGRKML